jgi:hypothetical protein
MATFFTNGFNFFSETEATFYNHETTSTLTASCNLIFSVWKAVELMRHKVLVWGLYRTALSVNHTEATGRIGSRPCLHLFEGLLKCISIPETRDNFTTFSLIMNHRHVRCCDWMRVSLLNFIQFNVTLVQAFKIPFIHSHEVN